MSAPATLKVGDRIAWSLGPVGFVWHTATVTAVRQDSFGPLYDYALDDGAYWTREDCEMALVAEVRS